MGNTIYTSTSLVPILTGASVTGVGPWIDVSQYKPGASFTAFLSGGVSPTATVSIDHSHDQSNILPAGVGTLSPTASAPSNINSVAPLRYVRANVTAIAGGGSLSVQMGAFV